MIKAEELANLIEKAFNHPDFVFKFTVFLKRTEDKVRGCFIGAAFFAMKDCKVESLDDRYTSHDMTEAFKAKDKEVIWDLSNKLVKFKKNKLDLVLHNLRTFGYDYDKWKF